MFQVWILYHLESPHHTHSFEPKDVFNWTATYRRDSDIPTPYNRWVYYDERVKQNAKLDRNFAANKTKKASYGIAVLNS
jgi:glycoprotein 3-alpha-L-fucosyltransferase